MVCCLDEAKPVTGVSTLKSATRTRPKWRLGEYAPTRRRRQEWPGECRVSDRSCA